MGKDENFDGDVLIEVTDEDGNVFYFVEEIVIPVGDEKYALLIEVDENGNVIHDEDGCDCGCEDDENVRIAKIIYNEDGEEEYIEPTDEEFERFQEAYEKLLDEEE